MHTRTLIAILTLLALALWLPACDTETAAEAVADAAADAVADAATDAADAADAAVDAAAAEVPKALGAELADGTALTPVADLLAKPDDFVGKVVRVQGKAVHRCGSGCSLTIADGESKLLVRADKEKFEFPAGWKDQALVIEGTFALDPGCGGHHEEHGEKHEAKDGEGPHKGEHQVHAEKHGDHGDGAEKTYNIMVSGAMLAG